ncbi:MAG: hypothetical protein ACSHXK_02205 [Oceanococcus sp.]
MDTRRRSTKLRLAGTLALLLSTAAYADLSLDIETGHTSLRFDVPDSVYAAGAPANFAGLQITDDSGRSIDFAVCPIRQQSVSQVSVPVLALPDLARPLLNADNQLGYTRPAGAGPAEQIQAWILDLRNLQGGLTELVGLPEIDSLRLSPNLQQWSAEIRFQQEAGQVTLEPASNTFIRIKPSRSTAWNSAALKLSGTMQQQGQRKAHWFQPAMQTDGVHLNNRSQPVFAARLQQSAPLKDWQLQSRQGDWDAWKPHGEYRAGDSLDSLVFSAVTDPHWRVAGVAQGNLQLAHAAHDIRIPQLDPDSVIELNYQAGRRHRPNLACSTTDVIKPQAPKKISAQSLQQPAENANPKNLRMLFLGILAIVLTSIYLLRRFLLRRAAR